MKKMKYRLLNIFGLFILAAFLFSACTKSDIEKAQDSYDWDSVQPKILNFSGPTVSTASGDNTEIYAVSGRGGSTYEFTTINWGADILIDEEFNFKAHVTWNQASVDTSALITVVETTHAGLKSDPDTIEVILEPFCQLNDLNDLVGSWTGTDSEGNASQVVTFVDGANFMINGLNVGWMTGYWGEVIVDQVPLVMIMNADGTLEIELQYYMETTWNGDPQPKYSLAAVGKWDNCKKRMIIEYDLYQNGEVLTSITEDIGLD